MFENVNKKIPLPKAEGRDAQKQRRRSNKASGDGGQCGEGRAKERKATAGRRGAQPTKRRRLLRSHTKSRRAGHTKATFGHFAKWPDRNVPPFPRSPRSPCRSYLDAVAQKPRTPSPRGGSCLQLFANSRVLRKRSGSCMQLFAKCPLSRKQAACLSGDLKVRHAFAE